MADNFTVLNSASATVTFRSTDDGTGKQVMMSIPTTKLGTAMVGSANIANSLPVNIATDQTAIPVSGTITAVLSGTSAINVVQFGGATFALGQALMSASLPVAIASNQSPIPVSGTFSATLQVSTVTTVSATSGAPAAIGVKTTSGTLTGVNLYCNNSAAPVFLKIYNLTAGAVNSSVNPVFTVGVPPGLSRDLSLNATFGTAISYWITANVQNNDTTAVNNDDLHGIISFT